MADSSVEVVDSAAAHIVGSGVDVGCRDVKDAPTRLG